MWILTEARHLAPLECEFEKGMRVFIFSCEDKKISVSTSPEDMTALFRKTHVKDAATMPASARGKTYSEMVRAIMDGTDKMNYIWSSDIDAFFNGCAELDKKSREITEGSMYRLPRRQAISMNSMQWHRMPAIHEAGGLPAIAKAAGVSTNPRITAVVRQDTIYSTVQAMGLPCKINAMHNVVAEVPDMQTAGAALQTIYQQFGVKGSFMVTWEGKGKLYWDPKTPVDRAMAIAYAKQAGLPPPNPRRYIERRRRYPSQGYPATARGYPTRRY